MNKYLIIFLLIINSNFSFSQGIRFQLLLVKACNNVEQLSTTYDLIPLEHPDTAYLPEKGTVYLPGTGKYMIEVYEGPVLDSAIIEIKDASLFVYRYKEPRIGLYLTGAFDTPALYEACNNVINGYAEDFYPDGKLRIRGTFTYGYLKDSIVTYHPTGKVQKRVTIHPKVIKTEEYDSSGNLIWLRRRQNKSFMTYSEYKWTEFYPGGKIKAKQSSINRVERIKEYYPDGQLKTRQTKKDRTEYYANGRTKITYTWKRKRADIGKAKDYTVVEKIFNQEGQLVQSAVFECWNDSNPQPVINISKSDWILSLITYKDGKETSSVKDLDTKYYLKAYTDDGMIIK